MASPVACCHHERDSRSSSIAFWLLMPIRRKVSTQAVQRPLEDRARVAQRAVAGDDRLAADGDVDDVVIADPPHREGDRVVLDDDAEDEVVGIDGRRLGADVEPRRRDRVEHPLEMVLVGEPRHADAEDRDQRERRLAGPARAFPADIEPADQDRGQERRHHRRPLAPQRPGPRHEGRALRLERPEQVDRHADQRDGREQHEDEAGPGDARHDASLSPGAGARATSVPVSSRRTRRAFVRPPPPAARRGCWPRTPPRCSRSAGRRRPFPAIASSTPIRTIPMRTRRA